LSLSYGYINDRLEQAGRFLSTCCAPIATRTSARLTSVRQSNRPSPSRGGSVFRGFSTAGNAFYRDTSRDLQTTGLSSSGRTFTDTGTPGGALQLSHDLKFWGLRNTFSAGGEIRHSGVNTASTSTFGPSRRSIDEDTYGLFAQDSLDLLPNLTLTGAVRYDVTDYGFEDELTPANNGSKSFNRVTPRAGLTYTPWNLVTLYANYGEGFRAPTTDELFAFAGLGSNPNLRPVTSRTYEAGLRLRP
jgi:outer membrane receptor protein involved in Fe transport